MDQSRNFDQYSKCQKNNDLLNSALHFPLFSAIVNRRSRRIMKGLSQVLAGPLTYDSKTKEPSVRLSPLEEALLISSFGRTGFALPDRPFEEGDGDKRKKILGTPYIHMRGRAAGSADNAQNTSMIMINDDGVYVLDPVDPVVLKGHHLDERLIAAAELSKYQIQKGRLEFPREFPYYFDSNRFVSNLPGSTLFLPIADMTLQHINGLMYLLTQSDGHRPVFVDDMRGGCLAGIDPKHVADGYLNKNIALPMSLLGTFRAHIESTLLLQNGMLALQTMGLGGWIHASFEGPILMGHPQFAPFFKEHHGLGFHYEIPEIGGLARANPVGLKQNGRPVVKTYTPYFYPPKNPKRPMDEAVDAVLEVKFAPNKGAYTNLQDLEQIFAHPEQARAFKDHVPHYSERTVEIVKDICNYLYLTHGRFPAHIDAIHVPGVWLQAHHLDFDYYQTLFPNSIQDMKKTSNGSIA